MDTGVLKLNGGVRQNEPFLHVVIPDCIDEQLAGSLLTWLEAEAAWQYSAVEEFYQLMDIDLRGAKLPEDLRILLEPSFLDELRKAVECLLSAQLGSRIDVTAHRMVPGCRIGIHTDYGSLGQTHRLLVHLNRGWKTENGGLLMFLDEEHPSPESTNLRCYLPYHRRAIGFEISPNSFHAVSRIVAGDRYALCFSFYADP
jgi:Rps23 Pro-64 3,4-dihydroxylase Tpa1-like proline 4-hydroxylase